MSNELGHELAKIHPKRKVFRGFKIKIDPDTKMPALPDGVYWYVSKTGDPDHENYGVEFTVWLVREDEGEAITNRVVIFPGEEDDAERIVREAARKIVRRELQDVYTSRVVGKYPPKRLEK